MSKIVGRHSKGVRWFKGKPYWLGHMFKRKKDAQKYAAWKRREGHNCRVIRAGSDWWYIYVR